MSTGAVMILIKIKKSDYVIFGDSALSSRQVNEANIAHLLEKYNQFFPNYGVGNYGLDQAYLRYLNTNIIKR